ncbi:hypothetical protein FKM82_021286 [Ascaphus truei]
MPLLPSRPTNLLRCLAFQIVKSVLISPGENRGLSHKGVIPDVLWVKLHLILMLSHTESELVIEESGILVFDHTFLGSQIRLFSSIGEQISFSISTHLFESRSVCHCTIWHNCAAL